MRRRQTLAAAALAAAALSTATALGASVDTAQREATASATAWARDGSVGYVTVRGNGSRSGAGTSVRASTANGRGSAEASANVAGIDLFDGLVTAASATVTARAGGGSTTATGRVASLAIDGRGVGTQTGPSTFDLDGYGTLTVLARSGSGITALRAQLTRPYRGHPAGATAAVAFAEARATDGARPPAAPRPEPRPRTPAERPRPRRPRAERPARERRTSTAPERTRPTRPARRRRAPRLDPDGTAGGYVFPVHGEVDFGAGFTGNTAGDLGPGCKGGAHEGVDVFAPAGAPVLAVTDGTLFRVGTLPCSGNRLWLRSDDGHTFFYAHLQAFETGTRNGRRVKAGDVIGFNGATGNARGKPAHVHFEIHPHDGEAVDPYPFLLAWQAQRDVPGAAWLARYGDDPGSRPGALVVLRDFLAPE